ncbi:membrane protein [Streptomyces niveus NCIMB 11891]|nr:membrane protein [Streptomyces niveus NCIMB 11891]
MLLLAIVLVVLIRGGSLKGGPAIVAILFGFFLASTDMAPSVNRFMDSIAETINQISF